MASRAWDNGPLAAAGAATWANGNEGITGLISTTNSLVGGRQSDFVGEVTPLTNGHYVVRRPSWDNGALANVGAATWGNGNGGTVGLVAVSNSLIGRRPGDAVGGGQFGSGVTALSNGHYVVTSPFWDSNSAGNVGAATWVNGFSIRSDLVTENTSLIGSNGLDNVGLDGVTALTNGNYVVRSRKWNNYSIPATGGEAGAATFGNGTTGISGAVTSANSIVGSSFFDHVGATVLPLSSGNYHMPHSLIRIATRGQIHDV